MFFVCCGYEYVIARKSKNALWMENSADSHYVGTEFFWHDSSQHSNYRPDRLVVIAPPDRNGCACGRSIGMKVLVLGHCSSSSREENSLSTVDVDDMVHGRLLSQSSHFFSSTNVP